MTRARVGILKGSDDASDLKSNLFLCNRVLITARYVHVVNGRIELEENGIYALPDGRELIARMGMVGNYLLHDPAHGVAAAPLYLINESGQLLSWGRLTRWSAKDLRYTGRISSPQMHRVRIL